MSAAERRYAWLLDPLPTGEFEHTYYGRRTCVVRRGDPSYFRELLGLDRLDGLLSTHNLRHPDLHIVKHGADIAVSSYTGEQGRVEPAKAAALFADGATLVWSSLHERVPELRALCADLAAVYHSKFQANVYLTPPRAQGFPAHWDTHDVFVLQIEGSKQWRIYDTKIHHPLAAQRFEHESAGPVTEQFELAPGDIAYIPRGAMHDAVSTDRHSLHITVGVIAFTWVDALLEYVAAAAVGDETLRESLPVGYARPDRAPDVQATLRGHLGRLANCVEAGAVLDRLAQQTAPGRQSADLLRRAMQPEGLTQASAFAAEPATRWTLACNDTACHVTTAESALRFPAVAAPLLRYIEATERFTLAQLPGEVDEPGKVTVLKHLLRHGVVVQVA